MEEKAQFQHSVKVPTQYKKAAKLLKNSMDKRSAGSIKTGIFQEKHAKTNRLYALISKIAQNKATIDALLEQSQILEIEKRLDKHLCYVLVTELMFGAKKLNGNSKPVECVRSYEQKFQEILAQSSTKASETGESSGSGAATSAPEVKKPRYVRVNINLMSRAEAIEAFVADGWIEIKPDEDTYDGFLKTLDTLNDSQFLADIHINDLFVFPPSSKRYWALSKLTKESKVILQDKASCFPSFLLSPPRNSHVLDMCAAPGMKTTHLAAMMKNRGKIWACELHKERYRILESTVQKTKSTCVQTVNSDALLLNPQEYSKVEYILLDPPCSGSGMTNRLSIFEKLHGKEKDAERLWQLGGLQFKLLKFALDSFPNAKRLIYSTCSLNPEENEAVVEGVIGQVTGWKLVKPIRFAEYWKNFGSKKYKHIGKKCLYALPEIDRTDGFFVAMFERDDGSGTNEDQPT